MTRATLSDVLTPALQQGYAVPGFVVLGWEDARAFVEAAEEQGLPVILQAGPGCRAHTPLPVLGAMFAFLAEQAAVPVVAHLDHSRDVATCRAAIDSGFTSVMIDGSDLPLEANLALTAEVVALARAHGVSVEAELGMVGYAGGAASTATDAVEAARMAETGIDALAVSVGNVHLMQEADATIDRAAIARITAACPGLPLVLHGGSGIAGADRRALALETAICKFNIGTELRMAFGAALRDAVASDPAQFDRIALLSKTMPPMRLMAGQILRQLAR